MVLSPKTAQKENVFFHQNNAREILKKGTKYLSRKKDLLKDFRQSTLNWSNNEKSSLKYCFKTISLLHTLRKSAITR